MIKWILIGGMVCCLTNFGCSQGHKKNNLSKVEINANLKNDFFNSKSFSQSPSSMQLYRNDTLVLDTTYASVTEKEVNAFIEDQYNKKFDLDNCFAAWIKDTVFIEFKNDLLGKHALLIRIFKDRFNSSYTENDTTLNLWTPIKERLVLNNIDFKRDQEIKGLLENEFVLTEKGVKKDSVLFHGPFYFKTPVTSDIH